jgi:transposase
MMSARDVVREIRRATRRKFSPEEKIRIVLEGLRGAVPITELCRREGIAATMYYRWSKAFLEAGKNGLTLDTRRDATKEEVRRLKQENEHLRKALAEAVLDIQKFKKSLGDLLLRRVLPPRLPTDLPGLALYPFALAHLSLL